MAIFRSSRRFESYRDTHPVFRKARRILFFLFAVFLLHQIVVTFVIVSFKIESAAMSPLYKPGFRIVASPLWYGITMPFGGHKIRLARPGRGDLVVVVPPYADEGSLLDRALAPVLRFVTGQKKGSPLEKRREWENDFVVKRIIALPGDTVRVRSGEAFVRPQGTPDFVSEFSISLARYDIIREGLPEGWRPEDPLGGVFEDITLGEGEYYVLGDNRPGSTDSRLWGPVAEGRIAARVLLRYWPLGSAKKR